MFFGVIMLVAISCAVIKVLSDHISGKIKEEHSLSCGLSLIFVVFDAFEIAMLYNWNVRFSVIRFMLIWFGAVICYVAIALAVGNIKKRYYKQEASKEKEAENKA